MQELKICESGTLRAKHVITMGPRTLRLNLREFS